MGRPVRTRHPSFTRGRALTSRAPIAIFLAAADGGGAERSSLRLAGYWLQAGVPVEVVFGRASGPFLAELPAEASMVDLGATRVATSMPALTRYLRRRQPRVLISVLDHSSVAALIAARLGGVDTPVIANVQNTLSAQFARAGSWRERVILPPLMRSLYPGAGAVVAVSRGVAEDVGRLLGGRVHVDVIENPVVVEGVLQRAAPDPDDPWFGPGQPPVIAGLGRLTPQKGFDLLLRAFKLVRERRPARLWIAGQGELDGALRQQAAELGIAGDVRWAGFVANPFPFVRRARVFALSSRFEGLPTVLLEALALGTRVVSTDCPSGPMEILEGGRWGRLVPPGDVGALAAALDAALVDDEWPEVPRSVLERYAPATILGKWNALFVRLGVH